jgi:hypothetical protein
MRRLVGVTGMQASVTDGDEDQAAAQDSQTSDNDSEEASGNAIKVTHDTPLGSKGDGVDQLIKTFGIFRGGGRYRWLLHGQVLHTSCEAGSCGCGLDLSNGSNPMPAVRPFSQTDSGVLFTKAARPRGCRRVRASGRTAGMDTPSLRALLTSASGSRADVTGDRS